MMFRTHVLFALFFYLLFIKLFSFDLNAIFAFVLCFGSILPDIDSPSSFVNSRFLLGIGKAVASFSEHRGFFHSIFGILPFLIIGFLLALWLKFSVIYILALSIGYMLHLAADSFNVSGIKWLWKSGHIKGIIRTGSIFEQVFFIILILGTIYVIIGGHGLQEATAFISKMK